MQTSALDLQLRDLGSHVLAPAQQALMALPPKELSKDKTPSQEGEDDIFFMTVMGALGLPAELHIGLVAGQIALDEMDKGKKEPQPNLTTQALSPNVSWSSSSALQLQGATDAQKQAAQAAKKQKTFFGGLKFH